MPIFDTVSIKLFDSPFYEQSVTLEDQSYILQFQYVERLQLYLLSIFTPDRVPVLRGLGLTPNYPMIQDYAIPGLTGYFIMLPVASENNEAYKLYPDKINEYYELHYVSEA